MKLRTLKLSGKRHYKRLYKLNAPRELKVFDRPPRKICRDHLAFFLGYLEGVEPETLAKSYLDSAEYSKSKVKSLINWLQDEFAHAAKAHQPRYAKLMRINPDLLKVKGETLEEFAARTDPTGFYQEAELIELFQEAHGVDRRDRRNSSLRQRIIKAVRELAPNVCAEPSRHDLLRHWFDTAIVERFANARTPIITCEDLLELMELRGRSWWRSVPKIGPRNAERIETWLKRNNVLPETPDQNTSIVPVRGVPPLLPSIASSTSIVPMERFIPPTDLSGAVGTNRAYTGTMSAQNDLEAIDAWLRSLNRQHTVRSYRSHAERYLLYMIMEKGKAMSSCTIDDAIDYRNFLSDLRDCENHDQFLDMQANLYEGSGDKQAKWVWFWTTPMDAWIGLRNVPRRSSKWRPFTGRLSASSQKLSFVVLKTMCQWLTDQGYLATNPFGGVSAPVAETKIKVNHALTTRQMELAITACDKLPRGETYFRLRAALILAYGTGLRLSELVAARVAMLQETAGVYNYGLKQADDGFGWDLDVVGKGGKSRLVPVSDRVMNALADYMDVRGFGREPGSWPEGIPLLATVKTEFKKRVEAGKPLSQSSLARILTEHFEVAASSAESAIDKGRLLSASSHWTRHTFATLALNRGADLDVVQELLGHSSPATTAQYRNADRKRKLAAVQLLDSNGGMG
jgi:site-specific recombinase XerD